MNGSERFCQNLLNMRVKRGLSQEEFAACCAMQAAYYGKLERKQSSPTLRTMEKICARLGVSIVDMVNDEVESPAFDPEELLILGMLKKLNEDDRNMVIDIIKLFARRHEVKDV